MSFTWSKSRFKFFTTLEPSIFWVSLSWVWNYTYLTAVLGIFSCVCPHVCVYSSVVGLCVSVYVHVCPSVYFTTQKPLQAKERGALYRNFSEFYKELSNWLQLTSIDWDSRVLQTLFIKQYLHIVLNIIHTSSLQHSQWIHFISLPSMSIFTTFSKWLLEYTCIAQVRGIEENITWDHSSALD